MKFTQLLILLVFIPTIAAASVKIAPAASTKITIEPRSRSLTLNNRNPQLQPPTLSPALSNNSQIQNDKSPMSQNNAAVSQKGPLTVSGHVAEHSNAKPMHAPSPKMDSEIIDAAKKTKEGNENRTVEELVSPRVVSKIIPAAQAKKLTAEDINQFVQNPETQKSLKRIVTAAIECIKKLKELGAKYDENQIFTSAFQNLIKAKHKTETIIIPENIVKEKAQEIWSNKEQYQNCSCVIL